MKLELGKIFIKDIRFDDKTHVKDGVLYAVSYTHLDVYKRQG